MSIGEIIIDLAKTHEELWSLVDGMHGKDEGEVINSARKNGVTVKKRSRLVEEIDSVIIAKAKEALENSLKRENNNIEYGGLKNMAETFGSIIDKMCINRLKIYHYTERKNTLDPESADAENIANKLLVLEEQGKDLAEELDRLLDDVVSGRKEIKVYRQFKM